MKKVSEMLLSVSGDMLKTPRNKEEMQAHLHLVVHAWNCFFRILTGSLKDHSARA
ncbi:hypothetical protein [Endozoicomonas sp. YOMI1]|uniref:hypothetical protein n=1 Tax=Endozoicomonas sp. YOMI1 TaxID=2828739 RepID=UPI0021472B65|nr:hypothetical protein [Endozoicomonas sp. YOMI1]